VYGAAIWTSQPLGELGRKHFDKKFDKFLDTLNDQVWGDSLISIWNRFYWHCLTPFLERDG
jgi:hypothetical protein